MTTSNCLIKTITIFTLSLNPLGNIICNTNNNNGNLDLKNNLSELDTSKPYIDSKNAIPKNDIYKPFFKSFDLLLDYGGPLWDLTKRLFSNDKILSIKGGMGLSTRFGLYTLIMGGYTNIMSVGIPKYEALPKYRTFGPHFRMGPGYSLEYLKGGSVIFLLRYGISIYKSEINSKKNNNVHLAHYVDFLIDTKARIISSVDIFLGFQAGVQFLVHHDEIHKNLKNYLIPGYGFCENKVAVCGGLYIAYCFQFARKYRSVK